MRSTRTRTALGSLAVVALLTLSACGGGDDADSKAGDKDSPSSSSSPSESADGAEDGAPSEGAASEPDLDSIPDVVAEVNGEELTKDEFVPIYRSTFQQAAAQAQQGGEAPDEDALKQQVLDDLVNTELLAQEAESRGIEVSDEDIDAELTNLAEQNGMASGDELLAAITAQGMDEDTARSQVETQVLVQQLVDDEGGAKEPSEKELRTLYAQAKQQAKASQSGQKFPAFDDVRGEIVDSAKAQETGKIAQSLVEDLRKDADITSNL